MANQLFPDVDTNKIRTFSCGHIIPPSNVLAVVVQRGPRGGQMEFKFQNREDRTLVRCPTIYPSSITRLSLYRPKVRRIGAATFESRQRCTRRDRSLFLILQYPQYCAQTVDSRQDAGKNRIA